MTIDLTRTELTLTVAALHEAGMKKGGAGYDPDLADALVAKINEALATTPHQDATDQADRSAQ
jgi:hypothetical protein